MTIDELKPNTEYVAYIITGSLHPGYPDLMSDSKVVELQFITKPPLNSNLY